MRLLARLRPLLLPLFAVVVIAVGCDSEASPTGPIDGHPATLAGTSWIVIAIGGTSTPRGSEPTIVFDARAAKGSGGCNQFGGLYGYDPSTGGLRFDQMGMTAMACAEPARNAMETAFMQAIGQPLVVSVDPDGHLVLTGASGSRLDLVAVGPAVTD